MIFDMRLVLLANGNEAMIVVDEGGDKQKSRFSLQATNGTLGAIAGTHQGIDRVGFTTRPLGT
ncbi:hypothetical protein [Hydrocarboniphaga sp.]|uniref:hypothetical protein n=1 Tax=Hydrocarboniphaga sp. TaxID=2033016 RepID=UPI003D13D4DB